MQTGKGTADQIVARLRQSEVELANGHTSLQAARTLGMTEQTRCHGGNDYVWLRLY